MLLSNNVLYKVWNLEEVARRFVGSLPRITPIACEAPFLLYYHYYLSLFLISNLSHVTSHSLSVSNYF